ncbi:MAG: FAD-dependent oxidoreductase [Candidatus Marinimicrobia bacterium]|nr:FAD-dependent oxidoreductase [Candidatus Neomarinimicrobiota bacterium]
MKTIYTDLLINGGGTSGVTAAIQAARLGVRVVIVEETPWLGGMLTAAGVSAIDGNHNLPSGLWGEFRQKLRDYYGGEETLNTGWVSHTLFEPHVADAIFKQMVESEGDTQVFYRFYLKEVKVKNRRIVEVEYFNSSGNIKIIPKMVIDASECGDLMARAGCKYRIGRESRIETGEDCAPENPDNVIQDITFVAVLKDFGEGADKSIPKPANYNSNAYFGTCQELSDHSNPSLCGAEKMFKYGRLPNKKYMINWPIQGNDYYLDSLEMNHEERRRAWQAAKDFTLGYIYYLQTEGGFSHFGLADDEFPTGDKLAFIPYIRESRRLKGMNFLTLNDIIDPFKEQGRQIYRQGVAVGDYPLDHHHDKSPVPIDEKFPEVSAFTIPYGCLVPEDIDNLVVAEKSISVSHIVNGCSRLQPVVMLIGQAAGASAALCIRDKCDPFELPVRVLQDVLISYNCYLVPTHDVSPLDRAFGSVQRVIASGVMKGEIVHNNWVNEIHFNPNKIVEEQIFREALRRTGLRDIAFDQDFGSDRRVSRAEAVIWLWEFLGRPEMKNSSNYFKDISVDDQLVSACNYFYHRGWLESITSDNIFSPDKPLIKIELAYLIDKVFNPFHNIPITNFR